MVMCHDIIEVMSAGGFQSLIRHCTSSYLVSEKNTRLQQIKDGRVYSGLVYQN